MKVFIKRILGILGLGIIATCASCAKDNSNTDSNTSNTIKEDVPLLLTNAEVSQESRLNMMKANAIKENNGYLDSDEISVVIELEEDSLIDEYTNVYSTKYKTVAEYAASPEGEKKATAILEDQNNLLKSLQAKGYLEDVLYQYSTVLNGIAIKTTYGNLEKINKLHNVASTYISETYNAPQSVDVTEDAVTNVVDVYETGIFNSSSVEYDGDGTSVAILDSGFDISHEVFQDKENSYPTPTTLAIDREKVDSILSQTVAAKHSSSLIVDDLYKNDKVPFAYDYADFDFDVEPTLSNHGTHVAGIIGGYYNGQIETIDNSTYSNFIGVAPRAQLVLMKVFSDLTDGADTEDLLAALEDATLLGVDAINMSLGTSCGFSREYDDEVLNKVYDDINNSGISLVVAASNSFSSGFGGEDANTNKVTNPESSTVGSPSSYYGSLAVASISGTKSNYIVGPDNYVFFYEESSSNASGNYPNNFYDDLGINGREEIEYVTVPGYGIRSNYNGLDVEGKIALVKRGSNSFEEKCAIAQDEGARGIIIYNNVPGDITMSTGKVTDFPAISITKDDGDVLAKNRTGVLTFDSSYEAGPFMSDFSSWGPTSDLKLKPEITAHGGNIVSAVPGGGYDKMSGTSMACPNMTGVVILIRQYLKEKYPEKSAKEISDLAYQLLMSTATIALNEEGNPYSPRKQGAGLASLSEAVTTDAYLKVKNNPGYGLEDGERPKLELGDDKQRTGIYKMTFMVVNTSNEALSYNIEVDGMTESVSVTDPDYVSEMSYMLDGSLKVDSITGGSVSGNTITVNPDAEATVTITYTLSDADKKYLNDSFPYGMYVEGFVKLLPTGDNNEIALNAPFLAFYGDWTEAPIFDKTFYEVESEAYDNSIDDDDKIKADYYATVPFGTYFHSYVISLGTYVYNMDLTQFNQIPAREDHIVISSNEGTINGINGIYTGLLRNVAMMEYKITDKTTGEVIYTFKDYNCNKAFSNSGAGTVPYYERLDIDPIDLNLVNNREYNFTMQAYCDYGDGELVLPVNNVRNNYSFDFTMDEEAPIILGAEYEKTYDKTEKKDRYYVTLTVSDNQYVQSITPIVFTEDGSSYASLSQYPTPVYGDKGEKTTVKIEITDYMESLYFDDISTDTLGFVIDDYALNSNVYLCSLPGTKGDLKFTADGSVDGANKSQQLISAGEVVDLKEYLTSTDLAISIGKDYLSYLEWSSSNPEVAIVDQGEVIGLKPGTATISVASPTYNYAGATITVRVSGTSTEAVDNAKLESLEFIYFDVVKGHPAAGEANVLGNEEDRTFISALPQTNVGPSISIYPGEQIKLTYNIEPWYLPEERYELTYSSSNQRVATVSEDGIVSTLSEGSTTITLNIKVDGKQSNIAARLVVNVKDPFVIENRILNYYKGVGGEVIIPDDEGLMQIAPYAFSLYDIDYDIPVTEDDLDANKEPKTNDTITKVVIPEGVTTIGKMAFANLINLEEVVLPRSCTTIEEMAFFNCPKLKKINLENVTTIEYEAFKGCINLESIDLSEIYSISYNAFEGCNSLTTVDISNLRSGGKEVFKNCLALESIVMADQTKLTNGMFSGCEVLNNVTIGQTIIPENCFAGCVGLTNLTFKNDVVYIGTNAFSNSGVTNIIFNGGVEYIYANAFSNCSNLETFNLPNSNVSLGDEVFSGCSKLTTLVFAELTNITNIGLDCFAGTNLTNFVIDGNSNYSVDDVNKGILYDANKTKILFVAPKANIGEYTVPETITEIASGAFSNNSTITSLTITNPNTIIGANAFNNCSNLTTVNLPENNNIIISEYAFYNDSKLTTVSNLDQVKEIAAYAFANASLSDITINVNVLDYAFSNNDLTNLNIGDNVVLGNHAFSNNSLLTTVNLGTNVTIGDYAFNECSNLTTIDLTNVTSKIGNYAFYKNSRLANVELNNATEIGDYAFAECSKLTTLTMQAVEKIGKYAFSRLDETAIPTAIVNLVLPETLKEIGEGAFANLMDLETVEFAEGIESLGNKAFYGTRKLTSVNLPTTLKTIGDEAFSGCSRLATINLENVETIGRSAFLSNIYLRSIDLASAKTINYGAFASCSALSEIKNTNLVEYIGDYAFQNAKIETIDLPKLAYLGSASFSNSTNLKEFTLTSNITYVGNNVFYGSNALAEINYVKDGEKVKDGAINSYALLDNGVLYTHLANGDLTLSQIPAALNVETYQVIDDTKGINPYAGNMNKNIKHLIFPDTLTSISNFAFYGYINLESVEFRSFEAPTLESFVIENVDLEYTDPGYEYFHYGTPIFTHPYAYYQFIDRVGRVETIKLILPANDGLIGYDTFIYEGYFGDASAAERSDYVAKDNNTLAFIDSVGKLPEFDSISIDDEEVILAAVQALNALSQDLTQFGYTAEQVEEMKNQVQNARYRLYELLRAEASQEVRDIQTALDNLDITFKLEDLNDLADLAARMNSLSRDERNILDLRNYDKLVASYNEYLATVNEDIAVVDKITENGYAYGLVTALVAATGMLGISLAVIFKALL